MTVIDGHAGQAWWVTKQLPTHGTDQNGDSGAGVQVSYERADGTSATVFVLAKDYNAAGVRAAVAADHQNYVDIAGLTG